MDQQIANIVGEQVLTAIQREEERIDAEIKKLESMDEDDLERLRQMRELKLRRQAIKMQQWRSKGHGEYNELGSQQDFFETTKGSDRVVVHFYRGSSPMCELVDKHLQILAHEHLETKFVKINAEKSPFLCERLNIWLLPSILLIKNSKTVHTMKGLDEMGGDRFTSKQLAFHMSRFGVLEYKEARPESPSSDDERKVHRHAKSSIRGKAEDSDED